jgi:hypothetical protein
MLAPAKCNAAVIDFALNALIDFALKERFMIGRNSGAVLADVVRLIEALGE